MALSKERAEDGNLTRRSPALYEYEYEMWIEIFLYLDDGTQFSC